MLGGGRGSSDVGKKVWGSRVTKQGMKDPPTMGLQLVPVAHKFLFVQDVKRGGGELDGKKYWKLNRMGRRFNVELPC